MYVYWGNRTAKWGSSHERISVIASRFLPGYASLSDAKMALNISDMLSGSGWEVRYQLELKLSQSFVQTSDVGKGRR